MKLYNIIIFLSLILFSFSHLSAQCETISFEKAVNSDWTLPENQDSLSPTVIITRKSSGSLYNIAQEDGYDVSGTRGSPVGTLWARKSTADASSEDYFDFVAMHAHHAANIIGETVSLYLPDDGQYFDVVFSSYVSGGGYVYTRTIVVGTNIGDVCDCDGKILDCAGECGGTAYTDQCGVCDTDAANDCYDFSLELHEGANLISFPCLPEDVSVGSIFTGCDGVIGEGVGAVILDGTWIGSMTEVSQGDGYWVKVSEDTTILLEDCAPINYDDDGLVIYNMHMGNNLISFPFITAQAVGDALGTAAAYVDAIAGEGVAALYSNEAGGWVGSLVAFEGGKGYWLVAVENFSFAYNDMIDVVITPPVVQDIPEEYHFFQSTLQAYFIIDSVGISNESIATEDLIIAYNEEVIVGARYWNGKYTFVPAMGSDGSDGTAGHCTAGDIVTFKILHNSTGNLINMETDGDIEWSNMSMTYINLVSSLSIESLFPEKYSLKSPYPNPFNPVTNIDYSLTINTDVKLVVYNIAGRQVQTLLSDFQIAGYHSINWNASNYPSGVYLIRMDNGEFTQIQKVVLVK